MKRAILMLVAVMVVLAMIVPASATPLAPGGTVVASPGAVPAGAPVATTGVVGYSFGGGANTGTYQESVYNVGGNLQFVFQVHVATGDISAFSSGTWGNSFFINAVQTPTGQQSTFVSRLANGTVDISWAPGTINVPGTDSAYVILQTNAHNYKAGILGLQDTGSSGDLAGFVAAGVAPEPATLSLLGFGLVGLGTLRKKLRK